ncbi:hypothetical protein D3C72_2504300 [compost metagenome]
MITRCGQTLKQRFGFPDVTCPDESPLSEIDVSTLLPTGGKPRDAVAERTASDADQPPAEAAERN